MSALTEDGNGLTCSDNLTRRIARACALLPSCQKGAGRFIRTSVGKLCGAIIVASARERQMSHVNDPKHWRHRAAEARAMAEGLTDPEAKQRMLKVAADYEKLAKRAEERSAGVPRS